MIALKSRRPASPVDGNVKSFKCCGSSPSMPELEPLGKLFIEKKTSRSGDTSVSVFLFGGSGNCNILEGAGCFDWSFVKVSAD